MRRIVFVSLLASLSIGTAAEARLFRQTYGAIIPDESGCGCAWNWNQDYFVPRHPDSCRYGLFSPCKTGRTTSPACKRCHPFYPGYCSIYGPWHYCWRNHVYKQFCGCTPLCVNDPTRASGCGKGCRRSGRGRSNCCVPYRWGCGPSCGEEPAFCQLKGQPEIGRDYPLPNVEPPGFEVLGSISVEGDGLLANIDLSATEGPGANLPSLNLQTLDLSNILPKLGLPKDVELPKVLPAP